MTTVAVDSKAFEAAHARLRADPSLQFDMKPEVRDPPPAWLEAVIRFLADNGHVIKPLFYALLIALALWLAWRLGVPLYRRWQERGAPRRAEPEWRPEAAAARRLLEEADALAREGRFGEAARLLLFRSIEDIDARQPGLVRPAFTAREIARADRLPAAARAAFATIATLVERSLFAQHPLDASGWSRARDAYADFAGEGSWR